MRNARENFIFSKIIFHIILFSRLTNGAYIYKINFMDITMMKMLGLSAAEAGCDLFLTVDSIPDVLPLVKLFYPENELCLIFLPEDTGYGKPSPLFPRVNGEAVIRTVGAGNVLVADIKALSSEEIRRALADRGIRNVLVPFAECAFRTEYGYSGAYAWLAEWRASLPYPVRVTALFSAGTEDIRSFAGISGSPDAVLADTAALPFVHSVFLPDKKSCYEEAAGIVKKEPGCTTAVLFTTRREADEFRRVLYKKGSPPFIVSGKSSPEENTEVLASFFRLGGVLAGTKTVLPYSLFRKVDRLIYCGLPYSPAHLSRSALFSKENEVTCVFCEEDERNDLRVIGSAGAFDTSEDPETILCERSARVRRMRENLINIE